MSYKTKLTRRQFLHVASLGAAGIGLAACGGTPTPTAVPTKPAVVVPTATPQPTAVPTKPAVVVPTATPQPTATQAPAQKKDVQILFWTQNYGADMGVFTDKVKGWAKRFKDQSGITVQVQVNGWDVAGNMWLLVTQGGEHPDCGDWYYLWSNAVLGGGKYGPLPITEYQKELWPDLEKRFYASAMQDSMYKGEFYGIVHRGDPRPMIWRTDLLKEAGFTKPPDTWDELTQYAKAATKQDKAGNTTMWGMEFGSSNLKAVQLITFLWQAGGEFMTPDGKTATVDSPQMRTTLKWMYDMIWTHKVVPPDFMEKAHNPIDTFTSQQCAILAQGVTGDCATLEKQFPQLNDKWLLSPNPKGPAGKRASYYGAGYWGVIRGTKYPYESAKWIQFLSQDDIMQEYSEYSGTVSTNRSVMASKFWGDRPWKLALPQVLEDIHPSQQPSGAWAALTASAPGAVIYDLYYEALVQKQNVDDALKRAQTRMQDAMNAAGK
jgi:multiple sugar transport system substrate-binding protein